MPLAVAMCPFAQLPTLEGVVGTAQLDGGDALQCAVCAAFANAHTRFLDKGDRYICVFCGTIGPGSALSLLAPITGIGGGVVSACHLRVVCMLSPVVLCNRGRVTSDV